MIVTFAFSVLTFKNKS